MANSTPRISIIIVNWNTGALLPKCLESVRLAGRDLACEVIVVDNASTDGSECVVGAQFPEFRLLRSETNLGYARANNLAARESRGDYLLFLNPDTVVRPETFQIMLELAGDSPVPAIVGCRVRLTDGYVQPDSAGNFLTPGRWGLFRLHAERLFPDHGLNQSARLTETANVDWVSGVCLLIESQVFRALGGFDEQMFAYLEDMDLCRRARNQGVRSLFTTATEITHFKGASFADLASRQSLYFVQSQVLYVRKHWPLLARTAYLADRFLRYAMLAVWSGMTGNRYRLNEARELMSLVVASGRRRQGQRSNF
jgi:hypothetical protein